MRRGVGTRGHNGDARTVSATQVDVDWAMKRAVEGDVCVWVIVVEGCERGVHGGGGAREQSGCSDDEGDRSLACGEG